MNDRLMGYGILLGSLLGVACYFYLVFLSPWILLVIQISAFIAVAGILAIIAWIGYTLVTTPSVDSLGDFESSNEEERDENG